METKDLKRLVAGLGLAGLLAGSSLIAGGCAAKPAPSGCGASGCGGSMQTPQSGSGDSQSAVPQGSGESK